jgi:hypothetical protein
MNGRIGSSSFIVSCPCKKTLMRAVSISPQKITLSCNLCPRTAVINCQIINYVDVDLTKDDDSEDSLICHEEIHPMPPPPPLDLYPMLETLPETPMVPSTPFQPLEFVPESPMIPMSPLACPNALMSMDTQPDSVSHAWALNNDDDHYSLDSFVVPDNLNISELGLQILQNFGADYRIV